MSHIAFLVSITFHAGRRPTQQTDGVHQCKSDNHRGWRRRSGSRGWRRWILGSASTRCCAHWTLLGGFRPRLGDSGRAHTAADSQSASEEEQVGWRGQKTSLGVRRITIGRSEVMRCSWQLPPTVHGAASPGRSRFTVPTGLDRREARSADAPADSAGARRRRMDGEQERRAPRPGYGHTNPIRK